MERYLIFKYTYFSQNLIVAHLFIYENFFLTSIFRIFAPNLHYS